jgi:hypothetical protein
MKRYIGKVVQLIYIDRNNRVSIRDVKVLTVKEGRLKAYCFTARAPRIFDINRVVDAEEVRRHA